MRCAACGAELIPGKKFCHACGTRVAAQCRSCGAALEPEFRFCPDCGLQLAELHDTPPPPGEDPLARLSRRSLPEELAHKIRAARGVIEGERKQVTVLFCDLSGSTAIAERLDPEDYHDLLDRYLELAFREIYRFEGIVNQLAGDGIMALFGAPIAHEDAPQRAIWAALGIVEALARFNQQLRAERGFALEARIGINTGPVVVGTVGNDLKMDYTAIGDTTNLAARLEALAEPGTILISETTARLVRGFFRLQTLGPLTVKGKREPVTAHAVLGASDAVSPMAVAAERGLTPLVGRDEELAQLDGGYRRLVGGRAQVVTVVGEAGSGKSRLLYEFRRRLADDSVMFVEARCAALGQAVPYFPFVAMFRQHFETTMPAIASAARQAENPGDERLFPLVSQLLSLPIEELRRLPPDEVKRQSFDAVARLFLQKSEHAPLVMLIEDLHWIDEPSRELLETLVARLANAPVMVVTTHRPDERATWRARAALTQIVLRPLSDDDARAIVRAVAGAPLPVELERRVVARAEGSPFFAEEITRALFEEGYLARDNGHCRVTRPAEEIPVPGSIQEVIAARLDRLRPQAKRVIQVAAVLGRQFGREQLAPLLEGEGIDVAQELAELEARGLVHRKSLSSADEYRFGESLTQEVAYESLLLKQRRQLHDRVGALLEMTPGKPNAERSALLAHHYARSENRAKAIEALLRAAADAEQLPSYRAAVDFFQQAWDVAEAALAEDGTDGHRRAVLEAASGLCRVTVIYGLPDSVDAERAAARARELAEALGDTATLAAVLYFQGSIMMQGNREQHARGLALAEQALALTEREGLTLAGLRLARGLANGYALDGRFALAQRVMNWSVGELERSGDRERLSDLYISSRWVRDSILYLSDELDAVIESGPETYDFAVRGPNRTVQGASAATLAQVHFMRGRFEEARHWADVSLDMAEAIAHLLVLPAAASIALLARVELGEPADTTRYVEAMEQGLASASHMHVNIRFVGEALLACNELERAERFAELLRARPFGGRLREALVATALGELMSRFGRLEEAERWYAEAIGTAEAIGSRSTLAAASLGAAELAAARGEHAVAARLAERTLGLSRELGLVRYADRAARLTPGATAMAGQA
ncbi:MAG TPA: adenylate/guanylate cyclase domain-containing protein [Candidatus Binatus sp.]|nr:adenylate/guanylate cyclase domain-containing protein [Candidatus Binatus sp.]